MLTLNHISASYKKTPVLKDISLTLSAGQTLAVVGESGAGKSTLIAVILGLVKADNGEVSWSNSPVKDCLPSLVMQEPLSAFNPILPLRQSVMEPLKAQNKTITEARLAQLCERLELPLALLDRKPNQVSIGQAQRAGILRALMAEPPLILFDEPLSALDAVSQKKTAQLIADLQQEQGFSALIVTHDLGYAAAFSDYIAVLRKGHIEEITSTTEFIKKPQSDYGHELRAAAFSLGSLGYSNLEAKRENSK
ncbi:dipeptide/oligopeptide/nickel ABC transporter ATP-binding protein [Marinomonas sp. 5E14-1]|uniref:ABC transporter ATP-binding protein n=1 Tax=Marinomonas sp. 5E14-1 TaxID=3153922 RepID=UPI003264E01D